MEKLTHADIVRLSYSLVANLLTADIYNGTVDAMCAQQGLSDKDSVRVARQVEKVTERLSRMAH